MKKLMSLLVGLLLVLSCSQEETTVNTATPEPEGLVSVAEVNEFIANELKQSGDVDWTRAPSHILYSAVMHGGNVLSVGYGAEGESFVVGAKSNRLVSVLQNIQEIVATAEGVSKSDSAALVDETLNYTEVTVTQLATIKALQKADAIRYLDPVGYGLYLEQAVQSKSAGCFKGSSTINRGDYISITPGAQQPWNFSLHKIPDAWKLSTGQGITVGLIDTGVSQNQQLLGNNFNAGASRGRTIQRRGTFTDSPWWWVDKVDGPNDKCGHGTQMASIIAGPRNSEGVPMGVAYNCNLISYRATGDVVLDDYHERKGVSNALKELADNSSVKIISMSIGFPWSIGNVKDAVKYAYSKGKLIIAAGGTSTTFTNWYGIIFPADMKETVAVTGIKDNGYNRCDICHDGKKIDFTIIMQRASNAQRNVPVLGFNSGTAAYTGGSSAATAATAGIAALIWSRNPNMSRTQVLNKLKKAAELYPNKDDRFGYGNIDALKAVQ